MQSAKEKAECRSGTEVDSRRSTVDSRSGPALPDCRLWTVDCRLVLRRSSRPEPLLDLARTIRDGAESHNRDRVVVVHGAAVDLLEEVHRLVEAAELGVVVLDVAGRELAHPLHLDAVDHGLEDALARRVLESDRDEDDLALAVLLRLVAQPDRRGLASALELIDENRRVEVQDEHGEAD